MTKNFADKKLLYILDWRTVRPGNRMSYGATIEAMEKCPNASYILKLGTCCAYEENIKGYLH